LSVQKIYFYLPEKKIDLTQNPCPACISAPSPENQYWQGFPQIIMSTKPVIL